MDKREFLQKYIISRTSHKRDADELFQEALNAYNRIENAVDKVYELQKADRGVPDKSTSV